jgi:pyrroloquinoline quinone biosynthesis protein B
VILTNGEVDAVAGLLSLREGWPFAIHAHPRVLGILAANSLFNVLPPSRVPRRPIVVGVPFEPLLQDGTPSGLVIEAFPVPGKPALYLEETEAGETEPGDTIGLRVRDRGETSELLFVPACAEVDAPLAERLRGAPLVFFDGTLWTDDEMTRAALGEKTGRRMGHMPISGAGGTLDRLGGLDIGRKVFIHINNSNPVLLPGSPERREVERAGWGVAIPGMEVGP